MVVIYERFASQDNNSRIVADHREFNGTDSLPAGEPQVHGIPVTVGAQKEFPKPINQDLEPITAAVPPLETDH